MCASGEYLLNEINNNCEDFMFVSFKTLKGHKQKKCALNSRVSRKHPDFSVTSFVLFYIIRFSEL